jgi:hypothetical protein
MSDLKAGKPRKSRAIPGAKKGGSKPHGEEALTEQVRLRLTAAQYARVVELAEVARVTPAEWARCAVVKAAG